MQLLKIETTRHDYIGMAHIDQHILVFKFKTSSKD